MARISGDQFAFIVMSEQNPDAVLALADTLRRTLATPITFGDHEIALTCSGGLAPFDPGVHAKRETMLQDAEVAMAAATSDLKWLLAQNDVPVNIQALIFNLGFVRLGLFVSLG